MLGESPGTDTGPARFYEVYDAGPYSEYLVESAQAGSRQSMILEAAQPSGQYDTPGTQDLVLGYVPDFNVHARMDFGAGRFQFSSARAPLFLSPPRTASRVNVDEAHNVVLLAVPGELASEILAPVAAAPLAAMEPLFASGIDDPFIVASMQALVRSSKVPRPDERLFEDHVVAAILARLASRESPHLGSFPGRGGLPAFQLRRAQELLASDLERSLTLGEVAEAVGRSRYHFARAFKQSTGLSPYQWRLRVRMDRARTLLGDPGLSIQAIGKQLGYDNVQAFGRAFEKIHGISPARFRAAAG